MSSYTKFKFYLPQPSGSVLLRPKCTLRLVRDLIYDEKVLAWVYGEAESARSWELGVSRGGVPFVRASKEAPEDTQEVVLVQEYGGAQSKRAFRVEFGPNVEVLSQGKATGDSDWERWSMVLAPSGWANDIAQRFASQQYAPDQTVESELS